MQLTRRARSASLAALFLACVGSVALAVLAQGCSRGSGGAEWPSIFRPRPRVMLRYEEALSLHRGNKHREAVALMERLAKEPLRLGKDSVLRDEAYSSRYYPGVVVPCLAVHRELCRLNIDYARRLAAAGQRVEALRVIEVTLAMARQLAHTEPAEMAVLVQANSLWSYTWTAVGTILCANEAQDAVAAARCAERSRRFAALTLRPTVERDLREIEALERRNASGSEVVAKARDQRLRVAGMWPRLVRQWDREVAGPVCQKALNRIRQRVGSEAGAARSHPRKGGA